MADSPDPLALDFPTSSTSSPATTILVPETPVKTYPFHQIVTAAQTAELQRLQHTRVQLTASLEDSTARNNRLLLRAKIEAASAAALRQKIASAAAQQTEAAEHAARDKAAARKAGVAIVVMLLVAALYSWWCLHNGPDMQYIRKRRFEELGLW